MGCCDDCQTATAIRKSRCQDNAFTMLKLASEKEQ